MSGRRGHITFDGVSKQFRRGERHDALRDFLPALGRRLLGGTPPEPADAFWAVRDVSFDVPPGRVLGIIGPNGAGKSTVLRLLTGIMQPTCGSVHVRGRIGALIEVAAGFHGDLTGRENVYLQGAVLGLDRREVHRRFDEIVDFAGVDEFIDTPVKRYSTGMNARLGFAVAAHLDPDVLVIDEVLAVGDLRFQEKALQRLRTLVDQQIPAVMVSHQIERIVAFSDMAIFMDRGRVVTAGTPAECVAAYVDGVHRQADRAPGEAPPVQIDTVEYLNHGAVAPGARLTVRVTGTVNETTDAIVGIRVRTLPDEEVVASVHSAMDGMALPEHGPFALELEFDLNVAPGLYRLQPCTWDRVRLLELHRGPSAVVQVSASSRVSGRVYLNPAVRRLGRE